MPIATVSSVCVAALVALLIRSVACAAPIVIDTVAVGNPGNAPGPGLPNMRYGRVDYVYNVGKYEVTAGQYTAFLNAVAASDTYFLYNSFGMPSTTDGCGITRSGPSGGYSYDVDPAFVNRPVNWVSFGDAIRFANWLHNGQPTGAQDAGTTEDGAYVVNGATTDSALLAVIRKNDWRWAVTSEDEWYKAAYYNPATSTYFIYPTSSNSVPGRDMADASGNNANTRGPNPGPLPPPIDSGKYTTQVGEFENSDSPYGTFDQGGNVWEWTEEIRQSDFGLARGVRGGSYYLPPEYLRLTHPDLGSPTFQFHDSGFRVSQIPEPASMAMVALSVTGMLASRRGHVRM